MHVRPTKSVPALTLGLVLAAALTGCGGTSSPSGGLTSSAGGSTSSAGSGAQSLAITVKGNDVEPENKRVEVDKSEPLTLKITSDRAGELHVHSSPEQHIEFKAGTTTEKLTFKVPGVIELEEHKSDSLIAQLEVR